MDRAALLGRAAAVIVTLGASSAFHPGMRSMHSRGKTEAVKDPTGAGDSTGAAHQRPGPGHGYRALRPDGERVRFLPSSASALRIPLFRGIQQAVQGFGDRFTPDPDLPIPSFNRSGILQMPFRNFRCPLLLLGV
jgi:hypothetical protein